MSIFPLRRPIQCSPFIDYKLGELLKLEEIGLSIFKKVVDIYISIAYKDASIPEHVSNKIDEIHKIDLLDGMLEIFALENYAVPLCLDQSFSMKAA